ncbi:MAG: AAA family ATPase [Actinobacteria bacterium 69-20]|nr:ATP-binding protein [Actinomycetota bacterium]OJV26550.1 MAG: AAA family ATPase [Actinobacteria bacterium 69-20]
MDTERILGTAYRPRILDSALTEALASAGAVLVEGVRACGKTMTALHAASSYVFLDDPLAIQMREIAPQSLLEGSRPRLLDEWQTAPELWNLVRREVDRSGSTAQFILTGSSVPADDATRHSGAGRFLRVRQRTLTWRERSGVDASVSVAALFEGQPIAPGPASMTYGEIIDQLAGSGFPAMTQLSADRQQRRLRAYVEEITHTDIHRIADVRHSSVLLDALLRALARSSASEVSYRTLAADVARVAPAISAETIAGYVDLFARLFVLERQAAWAPRLTSRARLRTSDRIHLADPALSIAALGASAERLAGEPATVGMIFESAVYHDLSVFMATLGGSVHHYRDSNGHEIDMVAVLPSGAWAAIEVKLGAGQIPAAATSLRRAIDQIDVASAGDPAFRLIITGTGPTLTLDDGTITAPLSALGP